MKAIFFYILSISLIYCPDSIKIQQQNNNNFLKENIENERAFHFSPRMNLPDTINAVVGYTQQVFFKGIIEAINPYQWNIKVKGNLNGKQYPRYYEFTPTTSGPKVFIIELWNNKNELVTSKSCTVLVSNPSLAPSSLKKILCIGDSLTSGGIWVEELFRLLTGSGGTPLALNLKNIEFIGTQNQGSGVKYEGYGGKTWSWYTTKTTNADVDFKVASHNKDNVDLVSIWKDGNSNNWKLESILDSTSLIFSRYNHVANAPANSFLTHVSGAKNTENISYIRYSTDSGSVVNRFWNTDKNELDIQNYILDNGFAKVDYVISMLTWNGMSGGRKDASDHKELINDAKIWLDKLHYQYPSCKVILLGIPLPSQNGGLAHSYGDASSGYGNIYDLNQTVFGLNLAYQDLANDPAYSSFVIFEDVSVQFDAENNFPEENRAVNTRNAKTEIVGINGVHPNNEGYLQIADIAFRAINYLLNHD